MAGNCHTNARKYARAWSYAWIIHWYHPRPYSKWTQTSSRELSKLLASNASFHRKTRQEPNNHMLLEEIRKAADASTRRETFIEEQITATKNSDSTSNLSYANIASQGAAGKSATGIPPSIILPTSSYNKANEIVIKLNEKDSATAFSTQSLENILRDINHFLQAKKISHIDIRVARKLKSGDIAIHTVNEIKTKKLVEEESWTKL